MFHGQDFQIHDEIYTMTQDSFSRKNVRVLTSVNYAKMSEQDKAKELYKRTDGDYALSWIRREGKGPCLHLGVGAQRAHLLEHTHDGACACRDPVRAWRFSR